METAVTFFSEGVPIAARLGIPTGPSSSDVAGKRRGAVIFCHGFSITKEIWFPDYAAKFREAGYITLTFDYRYFGESGGEPRQRLIPMAQVADTRNAVTYLANREEVDPERIGLYGTSFGAGIVTCAAGLDERVACIVATAGPADCMRQFRMGDGFEKFMSKCQAKRAAFVQSGELDYLSVPKMMRRDPAMEAELESLAAAHPNWRPEITFESMVDILEFKPEEYAQLIAPRAAMWIYAREDLLVPLSEGQSYYAKAREPKSLVILDDIAHRHVYEGEGRDRLFEHAIPWFQSHMPAVAS